MRRWATIADLATTLTREQVLDANDLLDAIDEAEDDARERAKK